ncbi:Ring finger domain-containing protein [Cladophialophora immunda]|nr:Ring finger domain-containing protein [Cladophialophora immunda]
METIKMSGHTLVNVHNIARTTSTPVSVSSVPTDGGGSTKNSIPIAAFALLFTIPALIILAIIIAFWYGARSSSRSRIAISKTKEEQKKFVFKSLPVSTTWGDVLKMREAASSSHQQNCTPIVQGDDVCAVCLEELEDADIVQRLPHCHHVFHRECCERWIDTILIQIRNFLQSINSNVLFAALG